MFAEHADKREPNEYKEVLKTQKKNQKEENMLRKLEEQKATDLANQLKRKEDEKNRGKPFNGKRHMKRSEPPAFKKQTVKKVEISEEEIAMLKYLGNIEIPQ